MAPTANTHTIVFTPSTKLVTIPNRTNNMEVDYNESALPKYAIGLFNSDGSGPRKRKRLTHLTPEEKIMRRKLKNRVAAQTARDRKKIKMESLEETIHKVQQQAKDLLHVNLKLIERAETLERENAELRSKLGLGSVPESTIPQNRQVVERIKVEIDDDCYQVPESLLSPDESADESDQRLNSPFYEDECDNKVIKPCPTTKECVSPKPAAGSCQPSVDPLLGWEDKVVSPPVTESSNSEDDILGLLEQLGASFDPENFNASSTGSGFNHSDNSISDVTTEQFDSIKELINVDHLYSKPCEIPTSPQQDLSVKRPALKVQLSRSTRLTKLIKQPTTVPVIKVDLSEEKPIALVEETLAQNAVMNSKRKEHSFAPAVPVSVTANHPMFCNIKQETDISPTEPPTTIMNSDDLDADLDSLLSEKVCYADPSMDHCTDPNSSEFSTLDSCSDTSSTLSDLCDSILMPELNESMFFNNDDFSVELFPQLAAVI